MAEGKKSVLLYVDYLSTFEELEDAEAGRLIKHLLRYVNDKNPEAPDRLTKIIFEPIKQQLKRDLKKWEQEIESKSTAGAIGNLKRWNNDLYMQFVEKKISLEKALSVAEIRRTSQCDNSDRTASQEVAKVAVIDNVIVKDIVIDIKDDDKSKVKPAVFFTITDFKERVCIGENEFTLYAERQTKKTSAQLKVLLPLFLKDKNALSQVIWKNESDAKQHFVNWAKKQQSSKQMQPSN